MIFLLIRAAIQLAGLEMAIKNNRVLSMAHGYF